MTGAGRSKEAANERERIYAGHPYGMKWSFFRKWQADRRSAKQRQGKL